VGMLKLAKMTKYTEIHTLINDFPAEHAPKAVLALIKNGLSVEESKVKPPTEAEILKEMDKNVFVWLTVLSKIGNEMELPEDLSEGNLATPISEQSQPAS
ncbi:MAG: hypothetical protein AAFR36_29915, partial [Bacteroidota bacterium]